MHLLLKGMLVLLLPLQQHDVKHVQQQIKARLMPTSRHTTLSSQAYVCLSSHLARLLITCVCCVAVTLLGKPILGLDL